MGGSWRLASFIPNSFIYCWSQNEAHTSLASFLWSPISGTVDNTAHQLGVFALTGPPWDPLAKLSDHGLQRHPITLVLGGSR